MMLSEKAKAALELLRKPIDPLAVSGDEMERRRLAAFFVAGVMLGLFPVRTLNGMVIRWDDEITPERLVASGFRVGGVSYGWYGLQYYPLEKRWWYSGLAIHRDFAPRNMGGVWRFMERCGIEFRPLVEGQESEPGGRHEVAEL